MLHNPKPTCTNFQEHPLNDCAMKVNNNAFATDANLLLLNNLNNNLNAAEDVKVRKNISTRNLMNTKRIWKVPWFLLCICVLQISIYLLNNKCLIEHLMFIPKYKHQYWRFISYMLLHSDLFHLTMNICLQLLIGVCLEIEQGHLRVAIVYMAGVVSGSLATLYLLPQLSLMGASAGVYGMLMSHLPHLIKNFHYLTYRYLRLTCMVILFLSDVCFTTYHAIANGNMNPRICVEAHIAGAINGFISGFLVYATSERQSMSSTCT
ncbi:serine protease rhomboid 6 isoform 1-T2 [Glossina fuscipes fuscipes]